MRTKHTFELHDRVNGLAITTGYSDTIDFATARATQLAALLSTICGEGFESFDGLNAETKGNLIFLAYELSNQVVDALNAPREVRHG